MSKTILYFFPLFLFLTSCTFYQRKHTASRWERDLEDIKEKGRITVITDYSSTDYFIYRGQPLGYQYEMLQELANHLGVRLDVRVNRNLEESFKMLQNGEADLIAQDLTITTDRKHLVDFTVPIMQSRQVLVQLKPKNWKQMSKKELDGSLITNPLELAGKSIYVLKGSAYASRLHNLSEEIGDSIHVIEVNESIEQLIGLVSSGEIPYTVCDEMIAQVNSKYYPDVDISMPVSLEQNMAWAVRKGSTDLLDEVNSWLSDFTKTRRYSYIYSRYYTNDNSANIVESDYYAINTGKISPYDDYIRQYSEKLGWDWRLLASLIYQESHFNNHAISWAGAFGLMQLMPATAKKFGVQPESSPKEQIRAGVEFIRWLNDQFKDISDPNERIKFILAAYNIGPGHIIDARNLARKNGLNPDKWDNNVDKFLLKKSDPKYYKDPVVHYGYCRGTETFHYVSEVLERYEHYKNIVTN